MVWAKLHDGILDDPKIAAAGPLGFALYAAGLVYANRNLTDGFIPFGVARSLLPVLWLDEEDAVVELASVDAAGRTIAGFETLGRAVETLVRLGLWERAPRGYVVHNFPQWNRTAVEIEAEREAAAASRRAGLEAVGRDSHGRFVRAKPQVGPRDGPRTEPLTEPLRSPRADRSRSRTRTYNPNGVDVDSQSDSSSPVGENRTAGRSAAMISDRENGRPADLADILNVGLVYAVAEWRGVVTDPLLRALTFGGKSVPAYGPAAVNAALEELYEHRGDVTDPAAYLRARAAAHHDRPGDPAGEEAAT